MGLAGILDHDQRTPLGDIRQVLQVGELAVEVNRHHVCRLAGCAVDLSHIEPIVVFADVHDDRPSARLQNRFEARRKGRRRDDHARPRRECGGEEA